MDHNGFIILRDRVKSLLDDMTAKGIHGEVQCITADGICNLDYLLRSSMFEATLNQKVTKSIDHERIGLGNNGLDNVILLFCSTNLEFLL